MENLNDLALKGYKLYPESLLENKGKIYALARKDLKKYLVSDDSGFAGPVEKISSLTIYERNQVNALKLRNLFKHLNPETGGLKSSFGFGDRLGLATPGHIEALKRRDIFPVFAQQSIREMERTSRTMREVLDEAMWGVFQAGYRGGYGADIDHVKKEEDVIRAVECGYTMYTIDPSDYINNKVKDMSTIPERLTYEKLYLNKSYKIGQVVYKLSRPDLIKIVATYSQAIKHIIRCYNLIKDRIPGVFDFEASVDETSTPTTSLAHIFMVEELRRHGLKFTSLALRFIGEFEKGIDYIGDLNLFKKEFLSHLAISQYYGGYKLSIHSGSDKFSIYPIIGEGSQGVFHLKTAGTSWLEAVRLISYKEPLLYRRMHQLALNNFEKDRHSYQVTTNLSKIPELPKLSDKELPGLLNENNSRQLMHITYGTILKSLKEEIYKVLNLYEAEHYELLKNYLARHLELCGVRPVH